MNDAHLHIAVNHFPIIGIVFGLGILLAGLFSKSVAVKNTAYIVFIVSAIAAYVSMSTGGAAAGMVKDMPEITRKIIHTHAEAAEKLAFVLYGLAVLSLIGLFLNRKNKIGATYTAIAIFIVAALGAWLSLEAGTTGGEIRHTEIRPDRISAA